MEDKAKQRALERFPVHKGASKEWTEAHLKNICGSYIEGYHQAEKDLELGWEDISDVIEIHEDVLEMESCENVYMEVLKRFKAMKEK